jgi:hypothetical protein
MVKESMIGWVPATSIHPTFKVRVSYTHDLCLSFT